MMMNSHCVKIGKVFLRSLKWHYLNSRCISDIQKKIESSYYFMYGDALLSSSRIGQVINDSADKCGDRVAVISVHQNISKTYLELRDEAERMASGLISLGLKKGDRIAICSPNCYEWTLMQFAAAKAGLILVNINPASQALELEYFLKKVSCKALVIWNVLKNQDYYKILCDIMPDLPKSSPGNLKNNKLPNLKDIIMVSDCKKSGTLSLKDVVDSANKESDVKLLEVEKLVQLDDPVNIQFTSGTTGSAKGAVLTHHNLVNNALLGGRRFGFNLYKPVVCCQLPLFHSFGCVQGSLSAIFYQGTCVFPSPAFDAVASLTATEKYRCSVVFGTPTMYVDLIRHFKSGKFNIGSLKQGIIGGAAATASLVKDIKEVLDIPHLMIGYGATETSPAVASTRCVEDFENIKNGVMQLVEYAEAKIIDSKGLLVPVNCEGELCVRGHNTFLGYWDDEEKTAEVLDKTHWYHTGDLATMNEYGFLRIVGRIKDMIIRGGENIYPLEVENFLNTHPSIQEVHICGVPDERMGEEACAWICLEEGAKLTEEEVREFCMGKISHFKIPRYILFVKEFPKTHSGKIKKIEMTKMTSEKLFI